MKPEERAKLVRRYGGPKPYQRGLAALGAVAVGTTGYVALNQDETPLTHRSRFLTMNQREAKDMSRVHYANLLKAIPPLPAPAPFQVRASLWTLDP